jgi:hypothetical protein
VHDSPDSVGGGDALGSGGCSNARVLQRSGVVAACMERWRMRLVPEETNKLGGKMKGSSLVQLSVMGSRGGDDGAPALTETGKGERGRRLYSGEGLGRGSRRGATPCTSGTCRGAVAPAAHSNLMPAWRAAMIKGTGRWASPSKQCIFLIQNFPNGFEIEMVK